MTDVVVDGDTATGPPALTPAAESSSSDFQTAVDPTRPAQPSAGTTEFDLADLLTVVNGSSWTALLARNQLALRLRPLIDNGYDWSDSDSEAIFARELRAVMVQAGAVDVLEEMLSGAMARVKGAVDTLIHLGALVDSQSREARRTFLERCLSNSYGLLRDAAALGLAHLGDERSLAPLERAAASERDEGIKEALLGSLRDLRLAFHDDSPA